MYTLLTVPAWWLGAAKLCERQGRNQVGVLQVRESDVSNDVIEDYERGFEYAEAGSLLKMKMRGDQRLYLVR